MTTERRKVIVALSGGVDSSVAAALLLESGCDVQGVFMITCEQGRHAQAGAEEVARRLGIPLTVLDLREDFAQILNYFFDEYTKARTPNPCVMCNRLVKFGRLWDFARDAGAEFLATGHYARVLDHDGQAGLYEGADPAKDQSYALGMIRRDVLAHILLPMGERSKTQARQIAQRLALGTETKAESQEICFIPDDDYVALLEQRHPELVRPGALVDSTGKVLGTHRGIHRYTIGQRRGLRVAMGRPYYVIGLDARSNTVIVGPKEEVMHRRLTTEQVNWLAEPPPSSFRATVKIRYNDRGKAATVSAAGHIAQVEFDEPNLAITPGQLAVFYVDEDKRRRVAGAGWIERVAD
ncbi:MAG TPA: tRNA 2-thiouridine(34) synthase MnmA [Sedimentisphaerales bacterium]|nr:tRNA 2-thiouridine(34) synthase MnmA [Sedimentisphaerales bacterium]HRS09794.1 tRNA 2-thiouridine(34) synthase MnmA [Sedimentisphaerales bacterium]HRV46556.1 tRNA 2-thiouridine(34) synthase MnmA [Sedimentisphaerales bacterium]